MRMPSDIQDWMSRGSQLDCFDSQTAQVRYATAYAGGDAPFVKRELERIFTRRHRMPLLNWLTAPEIIRELDKLEDGPSFTPEDWHIADFAIEMSNGTFVSPKWLVRDDAWDKMLVDVTKAFLFLPVSEKVSTAQKWVDRIEECTWRYPLSLSELVKWSVRAGFLSSAVLNSDSLSLILGDRASKLGHIEKMLKKRATILLNACITVLDPPNGTKRLLTLSSLRKCNYVNDIDSYLSALTGDKTLNLMTYLRCLPFPSV